MVSLDIDIYIYIYIHGSYRPRKPNPSTVAVFTRRQRLSFKAKMALDIQKRCSSFLYLRELYSCGQYMLSKFHSQRSSSLSLKLALIIVERALRGPLRARGEMSIVRPPRGAVMPFSFIHARVIKTPAIAVLLWAFVVARRLAGFREAYKKLFSIVARALYPPPR